jgi:Xaa-Pro aminopeptidase
LNRINALKQSAFKEGKFDFFLIFNSANLTYFTNFPGATALLIPKQGESVLYISAVNYEQAKAETNGLTVELLKRGENLMEKIANQTASEKPSKFAVDTLPKLSAAKKNSNQPTTPFAKSEKSKIRKKSSLYVKPAS